MVFETQEDFTATANEYLNHAVDRVEGYSTDLLDADGQYKIRLEERVTSFQKIVDVLTQELTDPISLYQFIFDTYTKIVSLEKNGLDDTTIIKTFIADLEHANRLNYLLLFLERGINQRWGYIFAQSYMALRGSSDLL